MNNPPELKYTREHEWMKENNGVATIGITHHAQHALGDVVYLELPEPGKTLIQDKVFGVVESVKAVSDLFAPVSGEVVEVNQTLVNTPEKINSDPYGEAWMLKIKMSNLSQIEHLMSAEAYSAYLSEHVK